eukprot:5775990-Alexandrium_andersonii.AAC.1
MAIVPVCRTARNAVLSSKRFETRRDGAERKAPGASPGATAPRTPPAGASGASAHASWVLRRPPGPRKWPWPEN